MNNNLTTEFMIKLSRYRTFNSTQLKWFTRYSKRMEELTKHFKALEYVIDKEVAFHVTAPRKYKFNHITDFLADMIADCDPDKQVYLASAYEYNATIKRILQEHKIKPKHYGVGIYYLGYGKDFYSQVAIFSIDNDESKFLDLLDAFGNLESAFPIIRGNYIIK